jgi:hypothetical protein
MATLEEHLSQFDQKMFVFELGLSKDFCPVAFSGTHSEYPSLKLHILHNGIQYLVPMEGFDIIAGDFRTTLLKEQDGVFRFSRKPLGAPELELEWFDPFHRINTHVIDELYAMVDFKCNEVKDREIKASDEFHDLTYERVKEREILAGNPYEDNMSFWDNLKKEFADFITFGNHSRSIQEILDSQVMRAVSWGLIEDGAEKCAQDLRKQENHYDKYMNNHPLSELIEKTATFYSKLANHGHYGLQRNRAIYDDKLKFYSLLSNKIKERNISEIKEEIEKKTH